MAEYEDFFKKKEPEKKDLSTWQKYLDKAVSPCISIALHLALLAGLSCIVFYRPVPPEPTKFGLISMSEINIPELKSKLPQNDNSQAQNDSSSSEQTLTQASATTASMMQPTVSTPPDNLFQSGDSRTFAAIDGGFMSLGDAIAGNGFGGNPFGNRRGAARSGGGRREKEVRQAIEKALEWLRNNQNEDGSWGSADRNIKNAVSSLAVLAFLAHGETPASKKYGECLKEGLKNLLTQSSGFSARGFDNSFGEALLTYALAEGATVTQVPELIRQTKLRAMIVCRNLEQQSNWGGGTSSAWNYQALKAALFAVSDKELNSAATKIASSLMRRYCNVSERTLRKRDVASIAELDEVFTNTYCLQLFGYTRNRNTRRYLQRAANAGRNKMLKCDWNKSPSWPLYTWYYRSNALYMSSQGRGTDWSRWNNNVSDVLVAKQSNDGSFYSPEADRKNRDGENTNTFKVENDLAVYSTAMCALILQTRYRYLPSYCAKPKSKEASTEIFYNSESEKQTGVAKLFTEMNIAPLHQ